MSNSTSNDVQAAFRILGMHCGSCEIVLERRLRIIPGIKSISVNYKTGVAHIVADGNSPPSEEEIEAAVKSAGYTISPDEVQENAPVIEDKSGSLLLRMNSFPTKNEQELRHKLKQIHGVRHTSLSSTGENLLTIHYHVMPDRRAIEEAVVSEGYTVISLEDSEDVEVGHETTEDSGKKWLEIGACLIIIFAIFRLLSAFDIVSLAPSTTGALSFGGILLIGIVAGMSSCLAVTGGLLLAMAAKYNEANQSLTKWQKFVPLLQFNVGRLASYFVLGGVVGLIGQSVTLSSRASGFMSIIIAFVMLYLALTILKILPKGALGIKPPKALSHWIHDLTENKHPLAPFALGGLTFFLPCGFTQSLQLVALASGSFITGAMTMFIFSLGTLPALLGISAISSSTSGATSRLFLRFAGTLVFVLALFNLNSALTLTGFDTSAALSSILPTTNGAGNSDPSPAAAPPTANGVQEVSMKVNPGGYQPNVLTVKAGVPVRWTVDGTNARGCISSLVIPSMNISRSLQSGPNVIEFTPTTPGRLLFSCSMGMYRGYFNVL